VSHPLVIPLNIYSKFSLPLGTISRIIFILYINTEDGHAFTILPLPAQVTLFEPVTVSWTRDEGDPPQWHMKKQEMQFLTDPVHDFVFDTSENLIIADPNARSGEVTMFFSIRPG
jgi:hypothetical protein